MAFKVLSAEEAEEIEGFGTAISDFGKGVFVEATKDPFIGGLISSLGEISGIDSEGLQEMERQLQGKTAAEIGEFVGLVGPTMLFGFGALSGGARAGRAGIQAIARKHMAQQGIKSAALEMEGHAIKQGFMSNQMRLTAEKALDFPGSKNAIANVPGIQRAAEIAGGNSALSSMVYVQEKGRGKTDVEALETAALTLVIGVGLEAGLASAAKLLIPRARSFRIADQDAKFGQVRVGQQQSSREILEEKLKTGIPRELNKLRAGVDDILKTDELAGELGSASGKQARFKKIQESERAKRLLLAEQGGLKSVIEGDAASVYTNTDVMHPSFVRRIIDAVDKEGKFRSAVTTAPEATFGALGPTFNKLTTQVMRRIDNAEVMGRTHEKILAPIHSRLRDNLGYTQKEWGRMGEMQALHHWEIGGERAMREFSRSRKVKPEKVEEIIGDLKTVEDLTFDVTQTRGKTIGARGPINLAEVGLPGGKYLTQAGRPIPDDEHIKRLIRDAGMDDSEALALIHARRTHLDPDVDIFGAGSGRLADNGAIDYNRIAQGTTLDKFKAGYPVNPSPLNATLSVLQSAEMRLALDPILGAQGRNIPTYLAAIKAESGAVAAARAKTVLESLAGRKYYNESLQKLATWTTSLEVMSKMTHAVFGNMTQPALNIIWGGFKPAFRGFSVVFRGTERKKFDQMIGLQDHFMHSLSGTFDDMGIIASAPQRAAQWTMQATGFNLIERGNRLQGVATANAVIVDTIAKIARKKLRGTLLLTHPNLTKLCILVGNSKATGSGDEEFGS